MMSIMVLRKVEAAETYHDDEDCFERGADENEDTSAKHKGGGNLLDEAQAGPPEQRERDQDEINVGREVCGKGGPDNRPRHGGLAEVARVRANLPVVVERQAAKENGSDGGDPACDDKSKPKMDTHTIPALKSLLPTRESHR